MEEKFSKRLGYSGKEKEIVVREGAPDGLRGYLPQLMYELRFSPTELRKIVCRVLKVAPDQNNWTDFPNIDYEINDLLKTCEWFFIYDVIESFYAAAARVHKQAMFEEEINDFFKMNGIGWKLVEGRIIVRGDETFEKSIEKVTRVMEAANLYTARTEIKEAIADLSRRPDPDLTGAIQHSLTALECVAREATGDKNSTLGDLMKKYPGIVPTPLDQAVSKIWGYTSEQGRHLREGQIPSHAETELVVELAASISNYLATKLAKVKTPTTTSSSSWGTDDLPF
jgi:hypothetical protein